MLAFLLMMTRLSQALEQCLLSHVAQCYEVAERRLNRQFPRPTVLFNQRGKIAGSAQLQTNVLRFQPLIYTQNQEHFLEHVVPHEIAHLIVWQLHGRTAPHGKEWQQLMTQVFELPPLRTHQYAVDNLGIKTVEYTCGCGDITLTIRRHNKVLKGAQYYCRACNETLVQKPT